MRISGLWEKFERFLLRSRGLYCFVCDSYEVKTANSQVENVVDLGGEISIVEKYDVTCVVCGETHVGYNLF